MRYEMQLWIELFTIIYFVGKIIMICVCESLQFILFAREDTEIRFSLLMTLLHM